MASPKIVKSVCPECGAKVQLDPNAERFKCEYCGTEARVENTKKKSNVPPVQPRPGMPMQPVIRVSTGGGLSWLIYLAVALFMTFGVGGFSMWRACGGIGGAIGGIGGIGGIASGSGPGSGGTAGQSFGEHMQWVGHKQPMLADVNRDGVMDVIGWIRFLNMGGGQTLDHLGAFNAVDGERLWASAPITDSSQQHQVKVALSGDKIVVADATGVLKAYSLFNGQQVWMATLGERADRICGEGQQYVRVETTDKRALRVALATGQVTPAGNVERDAVCGGVQSPDMMEGPFFSSGGGTWADGGIANPELDGLKVERVLVDKATGATVALGYRTPGTRVPTAARYTAVAEAASKKMPRRASRSKGTAQWVAAVPAVNPLTVKEGAADTGAISQGRVIVPYSMSDSEQGARLACLDLGTGRSLWDVAILRSGTGDIDGINVSDRQIFVSHWTYLDILDLGTGQHRITIGVW